MKVNYKLFQRLRGLLYSSEVYILQVNILSYSLQLFWNVSKYDLYPKIWERSGDKKSSSLSLCSYFMVETIFLADILGFFNGLPSVLTSISNFHQEIGNLSVFF